MRVLVLPLTLVLGMVCSVTAVAAEDNQPPNILLIVSDDQGYHDLGCYGSEQAKTPNLDRLAKEGVRLTQFYVTWPACTPSRGSLLTGRYPQRNGTYDMFRNEAPDYGHKYSPEEYAVTWEHIGGMDVREVLLPRLLNPAGYTSGIFGKWDLGELQRFLPLARGFDDFYGFTNTGIDYYTHERYGVPSMRRGNHPTIEDKGTYCTDLFHREATRFIAQNHNAPFLCYVPYNAPHGASNLDMKIRGAAQAPRKWKERYPELIEHDDKYVTRMNRRYGREVEFPSRENRRLEYLGAVSCMDDSIGRLLDLLDARGVADETIVIFFSDNGGGGGSDNSPLRGGKSQMFEGGIRVPCIIRWPGKIKPGTVCDEFLTSLEILSMLLAAAGVEPPEDLVLDGFDMLPVLQGERASPRQEMFWQRRGDRAARVGKWKWVDSSRGKGLFDLSRDIGETHDLSEQEPEVLEMVKRRFAAWKATMEAAEPRRPFRNF